jgi:hypothetical protein
MNYINKLKKLGFKKIKTRGVFEYSKNEKIDKIEHTTNGFFIGLPKDKNDPNFYRNGIDNKDFKKINTYLKSSLSYNIYINIYKSKYFFFIENLNTPDYIDTYRDWIHITDRKVLILIYGDDLHDGFWLEIINKLSISEKRELLLESLI